MIAIGLSIEQFIWTVCHWYVHSTLYTKRRHQSKPTLINVLLTRVQIRESCANAIVGVDEIKKRKGNVSTLKLRRHRKQTNRKKRAVVR